MKRSNSMEKGKRPLKSSSISDSNDDCQPKRQRPAFASVNIEDLKVELWSSVEPFFKRAFNENVERILEMLGAPAKFEGRSSPEAVEGPYGRNLQLHFKTRSSLALPLYTGEKVKGEPGGSIQIDLLDANSNQVVAAGPESCVKLDVVVLCGDFSNEDDDDWKVENFNDHLVKAREGKMPLLIGDLQMTLKDGVGTLGELIFTDNSSWTRRKKFRLGVRVASGYCEGVRIREAKTEAFPVKERRGQLYKKHYPPALNDEVWRLEKIGKDGAVHKRLTQDRIHTVEDFLRSLATDPQRLRNIMLKGRSMPDKMWAELIRHAKTCTLSRDRYLYNTVVDGSGVDVIFNSIYEFSGLIAGECYHSADALPDYLKINADTLVTKAYDNWSCVKECDAEYVSRLEQNKVRDASYSGSAFFQQNPNSSSHQLSPPSVPSRRVEGYNGSIALEMNFNGSVQANDTWPTQEQPMIGTSDRTPLSRSIDRLFLGPSQQSSADTFPFDVSSNPSPFT